MFLFKNKNGSNSSSQQQPQQHQQLQSTSKPRSITRLNSKSNGRPTSPKPLLLNKLLFNKGKQSSNNNSSNKQQPQKQTDNAMKFTHTAYYYDQGPHDEIPRNQRHYYDDHDSVDTSLYTSRSKSTVHNQHNASHTMDDSTLGNDDIVQMLYHARQSLGMHQSIDNDVGGSGSGSGTRTSGGGSGTTTSSSTGRHRATGSGGAMGTQSSNNKVVDLDQTVVDLDDEHINKQSDDGDDREEDLSVPDLLQKTTIVPSTPPDERFSVAYVLKHAAATSGIQQTPSTVTSSTSASHSSVSTTPNNHYNNTPSGTSTSAFATATTSTHSMANRNKRRDSINRIAHDEHQHVYDEYAVYSGPVDLDATLPEEPSKHLQSAHERLGLAPAVVQEKANSEVTLKAGTGVSSLARYYEQAAANKIHRRTPTPPNLPKPSPPMKRTIPRKGTENREPNIIPRSSKPRPNIITPERVPSAFSAVIAPSEHSRDSTSLWQFSPHNSQHTKETDESISRMLMPVTANKGSGGKFDDDDDDESNADTISLGIQPLSYEPAKVLSLNDIERQKKSQQNKNPLSTSNLYTLDTLSDEQESPQPSTDESLLNSSIASSSVMWDMLSQNAGATPTPNSNPYLSPLKMTQALVVPRPVLVREESEGASTLDNSSIFQFSPNSNDALASSSNHHDRGITNPQPLLASQSNDDELSVASVEEWSSHLTAVAPMLRPPPPRPETIPIPYFGKNANDDEEDADSNVVVVNNRQNKKMVPKQQPARRPTPNRSQSPAMTAAIQTLNKHQSPTNSDFNKQRQHPWSMPQSKYFATPEHRRKPNQICTKWDDSSSTPIVSPQTPATPSLRRPREIPLSAARVLDTSLMDQDTTCTEASEGYISFDIQQPVSHEWSKGVENLTEASFSTMSKREEQEMLQQHFRVHGGPGGENHTMLIEQDDAMSDVSSTIHKRLVEKNESGDALMVSASILANASRLLDLAGCNLPGNPTEREPDFFDEYEYHDRDDNKEAAEKQPINESAAAKDSRDDCVDNFCPISSKLEKQHGQNSQPSPPAPSRQPVDVDDVSITSEESAGAILLTQIELERHMKKTVGVDPSAHRSVTVEEQKGDPLAGYERWKWEQECNAHQLQQLAKQQAKAHKKLLKKREEIREMQEADRRKNPPRTPTKMLPAATAVPAATTTKAAPKSKDKKQGRRRWGFFGRRKKNVAAKKNEEVQKESQIPEEAKLQLAEFMSVAGSHMEIQEPKEVTEMSLAPLNTLSHQLRGPGLPAEEDNRTNFLAQQYLEKERRKEDDAKAERAHLEQEESERIRRRKEQALVEARRRETTTRSTNIVSPYAPGSLSDHKNSLDHQLSVIDSLSQPRSNSRQAADGSFLSYPSIRDAPSISAASRLSMNSSVLLAPCVICEAAERTHIAMPCMHYSFCGECVEQLHAHNSTMCPVCEVPDVAFTRVLLN